MVNSELPNRGRDRDGEIDRDRDIDREEREREDRENELTNNSELFNYSYSLTRVLAEVSPELVNNVLTNYVRGRVAPQVIAFILDRRGWTIPTISYLLRVQKQTIDQILKKLRPWVIQTQVRLEHPIKGPGNRPYVWVKTGVDPQEAEDEARDFYHETLEKYDPSIKRAKAERREKEEAIAKAEAHKEELIARIIEELGTPPDQLASVYEEMRAVGLTQENPDWLHVKNGVLSWIHDYREDED